jgi:hypothetical protein
MSLQHGTYMRANLGVRSAWTAAKPLTGAAAPHHHRNRSDHRRKCINNVLCDRSGGNGGDFPRVPGSGGGGSDLPRRPRWPGWAQAMLSMVALVCSRPTLEMVKCSVASTMPPAGPSLALHPNQPSQDTRAQALLWYARVRHAALEFRQWVSEESSSQQPSVSLIVPVLNEETNVPDLIRHFNSLEPAPLEVIFIDGGSTDRCGVAVPV